MLFIVLSCVCVCVYSNAFLTDSASCGVVLHFMLTDQTEEKMTEDNK